MTELSCIQEAEVTGQGPLCLCKAGCIENNELVKRVDPMGIHVTLAAEEEALGLGGGPSPNSVGEV